MIKFALTLAEKTAPKSEETYAEAREWVNDTYPVNLFTTGERYIARTGYEAGLAQGIQFAIENFRKRAESRKLFTPKEVEALLAKAA